MSLQRVNGEIVIMRSKLSEWQADSTNEWLTAAEAAQYFKVSQFTLLQWVRERKVPAHKLPGIRRCIWRFLRPELDAILATSSANRLL